MNDGFGEELYRKGNSMKRSGPFSEPPDSQTRNLLSSQDSAPKLKQHSWSCCRVPPDVGLATNALGGPPFPRQLGGPFPQATALPSPPSLFTQHPWLFLRYSVGAAWVGVGEVAHRGGGGGPPKRHLGPDAHLGAFNVGTG